MRTFLLYFIFGVIFIFLQSSVFPLFLNPDLRPNMILILVLFAGLHEETLDAVVAALLLGAIHDSFSGHSLGLYITVYLFLALCSRLFSDQLNVESVPLLLLLVAAGTLLQNLLVGLLLTILADTRPVLHILLPALPYRVLANLCATVSLLYLGHKLLRLCGYRRGLTDLFSQGKYHGA